MGVVWLVVSIAAVAGIALVLRILTRLSAGDGEPRPGQDDEPHQDDRRQLNDGSHLNDGPHRDTR